MGDDDRKPAAEDSPMADAETRKMKQGFGDAFAAAFELVATPAIFGFLGWLLDGRLGTFPVFTIGLSAITLAYASWRLARTFGEDLEKARVERRAAWQAEGPLA
ncbi:MAG: AtpZ/AtpI family protein [Actinomycetota bacterium]|nr:AtpZ/AtpI family protein [Actinomycetota bacterium]